MSFVNDEDRSNRPITPAPPVPPSPSIKPTSRARTYRIPSTSDAVAAGALAGNNNSIVNVDDEKGATPESFLWATREIAALDFLMNVPLRAEKDIVRAGLSGGRWHRHNTRQDTITSTEKSSLNFSSGVEAMEEKNRGWGVPPSSRTLSSFDINRNSGMEEEGTTTGTDSSFHTLSLVSEHNKNQAAVGGRWWDKLILKDKRFFSAANQQAQRRQRLELEEKELERPTESPSLEGNGNSVGVQSKGIFNRVVSSTPSSANSAGVPGRRLDGIEAFTITISEEFRRRPPPLRTAKRQAEVKECEVRVAYGARQDHPHYLKITCDDVQPLPGASDSNTNARNALLDGRVFFSTKKSYPVAVFSTIKYEPKKEETLRRRKQLEELGGGGTQFVLPERDWRGISYRALLPQEEKQNKAFNRLLRGNASPPEKRHKKPGPTSPRDRDHFDTTSSSGEENEDTTSLSSEESVSYYPGFLDDPQMVHGKNRNVIVGDKVTGPIISSTIQFVKPSVLKANLNKQFRERFDQWEPPKKQRKHIGARVIDGVYTPLDPTETIQESVDEDNIQERETIRMPPSLTLSKIRSLKQQALVACVRARIEISTLALACIYFERLCLDCRVDKSNRRLSFAACLLLAAKVNESNSMIAYDRGVQTKSDGSQLPLMTSWVKPNKKSGKIFESLIVFFTHDWSLSLKQLYAAEWIVFTALGFSLKANPSEVAFHFKRLLRVLEWNPRSYLGPEMYRQWQESLMEESRQSERRKARREARMKRNERKLLKLQHKLHMQQQIEDVSILSSRKSLATYNGSHVSHPGNPLFRKHSPGPTFVGEDTDTGSTKDAQSESKSDVDSPGRLRGPKTEGTAIRGILSRLSRQKQEGGSYGKELVNLAKPEKTSVTSVKQSISVPNLSLMENSKTSDFAIDFIHEDDNGSNHSNAGLFV